MHGCCKIVSVCWPNASRVNGNAMKKLLFEFWNTYFCFTVCVQIWTPLQFLQESCVIFCIQIQPYFRENEKGDCSFYLTSLSLSFLKILLSFSHLFLNFLSTLCREKNSNLIRSHFQVLHQGLGLLRPKSVGFETCGNEAYVCPWLKIGGITGHTQRCHNCPLCKRRGVRSKLQQWLTFPPISAGGHCPWMPLVS